MARHLRRDPQGSLRGTGTGKNRQTSGQGILARTEPTTISAPVCGEVETVRYVLLTYPTYEKLRE